MATEAHIEQLIDIVTQRVRKRLKNDPSSTMTCVQHGTLTQQGCDQCRGCHVHRPDDVRQLVHQGLARIGAGVGHEAPPKDLNHLIDHTLLRPDATREDLKGLCLEAKQYGFAAVCVNQVNVHYCAQLLQGSSTQIVAVIGFPLGADTFESKVFQARQAVRHGADEIDMVLNQGALKAKDYRLVLDDIAAVVAAVGSKPVKVILETGALNKQEKIIACALAKAAGAAFVKTSTGFGPGGATIEDVSLMSAVVGAHMGVKASGGVHTAQEAKALIAAGATRLGASGSVAIVQQTTEEEASRHPRRRPHNSRKTASY